MALLEGTNPLGCCQGHTWHIVACCLLIIGVAVNFDLLKGGGEENMAVLVGRAGWYSFWSDDGSFSSKRSLFLSLMPVVVLFFISLHLSIAMWR